MNDQEFLEAMRDLNREAGLPNAEDLDESGPLFDEEEFES